MVTGAREDRSVCVSAEEQVDTRDSMWTVIRQEQGLSPNRCAFDGDTAEQHYARHQRCILLHEVKPNVPSINAKIFSEAYGDVTFDKIRRWLLDEDAQLRLQAIDHLIELYVTQRENCQRSLDFDLLPLLLSTLATDEEDEVRARAAGALELLLKEPRSQEMLLDMEARGTAPLRRLLDSLECDHSVTVITLVLRVMIACHATFNGFALTTAFVRYGAIPIILNLLERHTEDTDAEVDKTTTMLRAVACAALVPIFDVKEAFISLLHHRAIPRVMSVLTKDEPMLIAEAAEVLSRAAEYPQGKRDAVRHRTLASLMPYLQHDNLNVRVAVAAALAQLTVLESGKMQALEIGLPGALQSALQAEDERDVLVFQAKLLTNLAEYPAARAQLRGCRPRLEELCELAYGDDSVVSTLTAALRMLARG